jgi:hypothetical protein
MEDNGLRISQLELELNILGMDIGTRKIELMSPSVTQSRREEIQHNLSALQAKEKELTDELNKLRQNK